MGPMVLCVTTLGTIRVPLLSADNWDSLNMVKRQKKCNETSETLRIK